MTQGTGTAGKVIADTLAERGGRYGPWRMQSQVTQQIKRAMADTPNWDKLPDYLREALDQIANKIARILSGDYMYDDNLHDLVGYAKLAEDCLLQDIAAGVESPVIIDPDNPPIEWLFNKLQEKVPVPTRPRWLDQAFHHWLPRRFPDGRWEVVMERPQEPPLLFIDEMDRDVSYVMDEDEAISRARMLNVMGFKGYDPNREHWLAKPMDEVLIVDPSKVRDPAYLRDPLRAVLAGGKDGD